MAIRDARPRFRLYSTIYSDSLAYIGRRTDLGSRQMMYVPTMQHITNKRGAHRSKDGFFFQRANMGELGWRARRDSLLAFL